MGIVFDVEKNNYQLNLEWMCFGLDLFGDNLVESYVYQFEDLEILLRYIDEKHQIKISDINPNYTFNDADFPNPIKNKEQKEVYTKYWNQFQTILKKVNF